MSLIQALMVKSIGAGNGGVRGRSEHEMLRRVFIGSRTLLLSLLGIFATLFATARPGVAQDQILGWGDQVFDSAAHQ